MRLLLLALVGATFTGLLLVAPANHAAVWLGAPLDQVGWLLVALPLVALAAALAWPRPWLTLWAYPAAHLPALAALPQLTAPSLYGGSDGFWALVAVTLSGAAWYVAQLWPVSRTHPLVVTPPADASAPASPPLGRTLAYHGLQLGAGAFAVAIFAVFAHAAFASDDPTPEAANVTLLAGGCAAWYAAGRLVAGRLADAMLSPSERRRYQATALLVRRPAPRRVAFAVAAAAISGAVLIIWQLSESAR